MKMTDEMLMLESGEGSITAFELLLQRWDRRMLHYYIRCTGNRQEAEDLRQELFLRIYKQRKTFKPSGSFQSWIYRIATNLMIDKVIRKKRIENTLHEIEHNDEILPPNMNEPNAVRKGLIREEIRQMIEAALSRIPQEQRIPIVMRHYENLSFAEIANILSVPVSTVKTRVDRGLEALRIAFKRQGLLDIDCLQEI